MREKIKKLIAFLRDWDNQSRCLKWMIIKTKPFIWSLMLVLMLNLLISVMGVGGTVVTKYIIDGATGAGKIYTTPGIAVLIVLTLIAMAVSAFSGIITTLINERYAFSIRLKVYDNVLQANWQKIMSFHSGDIVTRLTGDIEAVSNGISSIIPGIIFLFIRLTIAFCVLFFYDHFLALAALILGPVGVFLSLVFSGKLKYYQEELRKTESEYRSFLQETIENITVVKTFEQENYCGEKLLKLRNRRLKLIVKRNKLNIAISLCIRFTFNAGYLIAFSWGIFRLSNNSITYGTMSIFLALVSQVQGPIVELGNIIPQFISVLTSTGRVIEIDSIEKETFAESIMDLTTSNIGLTIENVSFSYGREVILENINLDIKPNDIVGIVGYSGSGKTTLVRLILALVSPEANGRLTFYNDTGAIEEASVASRRFISYVPQGNTLISGTIAENLNFGNKDATEADMWRALEIADAAEFVQGFNEGLHTVIGEKASGLSEGQAQRIAIARSIIKTAPILILDEATSALDAQTEDRIIKKMCASNLIHTCFIITHRRSMLSFCTRALEIDDKFVNEFEIV